MASAAFHKMRATRLDPVWRFLKNAFNPATGEIALFFNDFYFDSFPFDTEGDEYGFAIGLFANAITPKRVPGQVNLES